VNRDGLEGGTIGVFINNTNIDISCNIIPLIAMIWIFYPMACAHGCVEEITDVWDESHRLLLTGHHAVKVINNMERPVITRHINTL